MAIVVREDDTIVRLEDVVRRINSAGEDDEVLVIESTMNEVHPQLPVRFAALVIVLVEDGEGYIEINLQRYSITPGTLLVLTPKDYVSGFSETRNGCAKVMMCSNRIVENVLPKIRDLLPLLINHVEQPVLHLKDDEFMMLHDMMSLISRHINKTDSMFRHQKVSAMMQTILFELLEMRRKATTARQAGSTRKEEIMSKFLKLVSANFMTCRTVQYYAQELCITPKHLTTTVKEVSTRTAREWIDDFVIMEAKQLLRISALTIQEISDRLHFANQSFFGKYFRNLTGESPSEYRRKIEVSGH